MHSCKIRMYKVGSPLTIDTVDRPSQLNSVARAVDIYTIRHRLLGLPVNLLLPLLRWRRRWRAVRPRRLRLLHHLYLLFGVVVVFAFFVLIVVFVVF